MNMCFSTRLIWGVAQVIVCVLFAMPSSVIAQSGKDALDSSAYYRSSLEKLGWVELNFKNKHRRGKYINHVFDFSKFPNGSYSFKRADKNIIIGYIGLSKFDTVLNERFNLIKGLFRNGAYVEDRYFMKKVCIREDLQCLFSWLYDKIFWIKSPNSSINIVTELNGEIKCFGWICDSIYKVYPDYYIDLFGDASGIHKIPKIDGFRIENKEYMYRRFLLFERSKKKQNVDIEQFMKIYDKKIERLDCFIYIDGSLKYLENAIDSCLYSIFGVMTVVSGDKTSRLRERL